MQGADVLLTIAELAVAFAGFASVVVLFQHRDPRNWSPSVIVRLRTMIEGSLTALFSALLPFILYHMGLADEMLWSISSSLLALGLIGTSALTWRRSRVPLAGGQLSRSFTISVGVIAVVIIIALMLNAAGVLFHREFGPYLIGVTWNLVFASLMFLRVVVLGGEAPSAD